MTQGIPGLAVGITVAGGVLVWSGVCNQSLTSTLGSLLKGSKPTPGPQAATAAVGPVTNTASSSPDSVSAKANQATGRLMATAYGWGTGAEWTALNNIVMAESGWSATVTNPSSGAAGIAQNISGFGPGYESGNAPQQIAWLLSYIKGRYGDPVKAWAFHLANGYY